MAQAPQYSDQQRQFLRMLILKMMQERMVQQGGTPPEKSSLDQFLDFAKKAKSTYDDGKKLYDVGTSISNYFNPTYSEATQSLWNQAAGEASQQAWNAGADAATEALGQTATTEAGSAMADAGPWAAAVMSAFNSAQKVMDKNARDEQQAYDGAMAVPRAAAAYYTAGLSTLGENFARSRWGGTMKKLDKFNQNNPMSPVFVPMQASRLWTSDKWKTEGKRLQGLIDRGINIPEEMRAAMYQQKGRKKSELINPYLPQDFVGETPQYGWTNNKFANSRDEKDLTAKDIWGYSAFFDKFGNDWMGKYNANQREAIANKALQRGAVREHHGTIDINWTPELDADITGIGGNQIPRANNDQPTVRPPAPLPANFDSTQPIPSTPQRKGILGRLKR